MTEGVLFFFCKLKDRVEKEKMVENQIEENTKEVSDIPEYTYRCRKCDAVFQDLNTISKRATTDCKCGSKADRDWDAELAHPVSRTRPKWITENERWSRSMGVPVKQLTEFRKRYPHSTYDGKGRLLIKSRSDKKRQMRERGFVELNDNKH